MRPTLEGVVLGGLGHMGSLHVRKLQARGDVNVRVVDPPRGAEGPVGHPDFVVLAAPTSLHLDLALPVLEASIPCLVEKPLAPTSAQARHLASYAGCCPGHVERFNPAVLALGRVRARFVQAERIAPPTGRSADVDVISDVMVHDLDLAAWLLGEPVTDVRAIGLSFGGAAVDIANARLETASGGVATCTASRVSRKAVRSLRVFSERDYWSLDLLGRRGERVPWGEGRLEAEPIPVPPGDALEAELDAFLAFVRGEAPFPVPAADAALAVELAERVKREMKARAVGQG